MSAKKRLYVDTSAYLCVLLGENGHKLLEKEMALLTKMFRLT